MRAESRSRRQVTLTNPGRTALRGHLAALQAIAATAEPATAEKPSAPVPRTATRPVERPPSIPGSHSYVIIDS